MLQQQTQSPGWRVLNRDVIKYIAMTAMLLNHIANIFLVPGTLWYEVLVDIGGIQCPGQAGRASAPGGSGTPTAANSMPYGCSGSVWFHRCRSRWRLPKTAFWNFRIST